MKKLYKAGIRTLVMDYERAHSEPINAKAVARLKHTYDIPTKIRVRRTTKPSQPKQSDNPKVHTNVLNREFTAVRSPFFATGSDVTYIRWKGRWIYLSAVKDFVTAEFLAWNISFHNDNDLALETVRLLQVNHRDHIAQGMFLQLDQGSQYTSTVYQKETNAMKLVISMSRKGRCIDNAPTESGWGHLKDWIDVSTCETLEEVRAHIDAVMLFFNEERPQWTRKKMTPIEYRNHLLITQ
jgi:transposase InsO family protein